jgi:hypothetical protein
MASTEGASESPAPATRTFPLRTLAFIIWLVILDLWLEHTWGVGVKNPGWLASLAGSLTAILGLLEKHVDEQELKFVKIPLPRPSFFLLAIGYLVLAILIFTYAAVVIVGDASQESLTVTLSNPWTGEKQSCQGDERTEQDNQRKCRTGGLSLSPLRFVVHTSPFGRVYRLKVDGYLARYVEVYPFAGVEINPQRDLSISPSILLRPPVNALRELADGGLLVVRYLAPTGEQMIACDDSGNSSAFLLGREQPIPDLLLASWKLETQAEKLSPSAEAEALLKWRRAKVLTPKVELAPEMKIQAQVVTRGRAVISQVVLALGDEKLTDVAMSSEPDAKLVSAMKCPSVP